MSDEPNDFDERLVTRVLVAAVLFYLGFYVVIPALMTFVRQTWR
jgi:hypothetical protein